ncbi:uncharacterized protein LOC130676888 [Microplitis mediator]|uniref:uncharacterized protein LOC130676888 n=1 Tax=Microplitis mediator TaxID=375433 RepID=UPI0025574CA9|nr:uncharacterized protein LOC130676888 [Microplitis mediator]
MPTVLTPLAVHAVQQNDLELVDLIKNSSSLKLQKLCIEESDVYCDIATGIVKPYIPQSLRRAAFGSVHYLSHSSRKTTSNTLRQKCTWPGIRKDAIQWSREWLACQRSKVHRHNKIKPNHIETPDNRFNHIHLDIIFLPKVDGYQYCLTIIDRFTRWPVAVPIKDMTADTVVTALFDHWIAHYGTPIQITTDQGMQFESALFTALAQLIGADKTTPYHPQSNGIVERMHRTPKGALMCSPKPWTQILSTALLGLRTSFKEDIHATPVEMLYGTCLRVPGEFFVTAKLPGEPQIFVEKHRESMRGLRPTPTAHYNKARIYILKNLDTCSHVFVRCDHVKASLEASYIRPY